MNKGPTIFKTEKIAYFTVWILAVFYSVYYFGNSSYKFFQNYRDEYNDFTTGLHFLSKRRDKADFEWEVIFYLLHHFYPWIFLYMIVSEISRGLQLTIKVSQIWQICFTMFYIEVQIGYIFILMILFQPVVFYFTSSIFKNSVSTWLCTGITLSLITYYKRVNTNEEIQKFPNLNDYNLFLTTLSLFWLNLKCTSYCLEKPNTIGFLDLLSYCLYPPTFFTGPFISYKDFQSIYNPTEYSPVQQRIKKFVLNFTRSLFWFLFGNFCLHYIYVNATSFQPKFVMTLNSWSLYGYGYTMGQYFHIKYVILYGLSTSVASYENVNVPHLPRCIGRVHLYSDMWKYFDPGLYKFLVRHIYIPAIKTVSYRFIASLLCFLFVYVWHGIEDYVLVWSVLNYIGVNLEYICNSLNEKYFEYGRYRKLLNPYWSRRIKCFLAAPLLIMSAVSNFYFFAGTEIGNIFFYRILTDNEVTNILLVLVLYCCCQVSAELRIINANRM